MYDSIKHEFQSDKAGTVILEQILRLGEICTDSICNETLLFPLQDKMAYLRRLINRCKTMKEIVMSQELHYFLIGITTNLHSYNDIRY